jgi:hypothetical protein
MIALVCSKTIEVISHYVITHEVHPTLGVAYLASPLRGGERTKVRGFRTAKALGHISKSSPSPSPFAHSFALTGAYASVSPKRGEKKGEATQMRSWRIQRR